jgi:hypothetical protein
MGDPQAPFAKVLAVLDRHGALAGDRLADDVVLVSIGDHFDYDHADPVSAGREGVALLRWLAGHDPAQVTILFGNHDAARVMELATIDDAAFAAARACTPADFAARFPTLPPHGVIARDYASFSVEQRELVAELLVAGRFRLAAVGALGGRDALLTHAGVTTRELRLLGLGLDANAHAIARALNAHLDLAVRRGVAPLSLEPLHRAGRDGEEGDGLLYHRPSANAKPRRFDPRTLPDDVLQVAGHSGHAKCVEELGAWCTERARARERGGIRTLTVAGDEVTYDAGVEVSATAGSAALILVDGELRRLPPDEVDLLPLDRLV